MQEKKQLIFNQYIYQTEILYGKITQIYEL